MFRNLRETDAALRSTYTAINMRAFFRVMAVVILAGIPILGILKAPEWVWGALGVAVLLALVGFLRIYFYLLFHDREALRTIEFP